MQYARAARSVVKFATGLDQLAGLGALPRLA